MTQEELILDGKTYVSSKRAAQLSQYAQDYIGQMCRAGHADCRRVNGLWYVTLESLERHKAVSEEVKARAFDNLPPREPNQLEDTILTFSGDEYVSSKYGSELTGYNPDYVTQLARSGKVRARQVGNRWYIARKDLVDNKERNDALLAEVQARAVGVNPIAEKLEYITINRTSTLLNYKPDNAPLMPTIPKAKSEPASFEEKTQKDAEKQVFESQYRIITAKVDPIVAKSAPGVRGRRLSAHLVVAATVLVIISAGGYAGIRGGYFSRNGASDVDYAAVAIGANSDGGLLDILIGLATDVVSYRRAE